MKRHYLSLWALLGCAFVVFALASAFDMPQVMGHQLKSAGIVEELTADVTPTPPTVIAPIDTVRADTIPADTIPPDTIPANNIPPDTIPAPVAVPVDTVKQTILLAGDSMLEGIGRRLAAYADASGYTLYSVIWYSSTTAKWGKSNRLRSYIKRLKPTYVILCLGANELSVRDIVNQRSKYVDSILCQIDTLPYLWIGPPNWKDDTGINTLIASKTESGTFFESRGMHFERSKDGAHPTYGSAALWVDSIARWIPGHARYPLPLEEPTVDTSRPKRTYTHKPSE